MGQPSRVWPALAVLGTWSAAAPFVGDALGLELPVPVSVEIVDHVVPGVAIIVCALALVVGPKLRRPESPAPLVLAAVCVLAALWITVSHLPLLVDAADGTVPTGAAILHAASGPPLLALALLAFVDAYRTEGRTELR